MKLTPDQRRQRLLQMMEDDPGFSRITASFLPATARFDSFTARLPRKLCNRLREYPGMFYFLYQRLIDTVCQHMRFPDED